MTQRPISRKGKITPGAASAPKNYYFTKEHEDAIIEYATAVGPRREYLYEKIISPVLSEMVDKICYTFKFTSIPNIDSLREECKIWLATILDKYDPAKGYTAFAYFSVITKNWFIHKVKKNTTLVKKEVAYEDVTKQVECEYLSEQIDYLEIREKEEWWMEFYRALNEWSNEPMKPAERKVYDAVCVLMGSAEQIEIFNKKAIYLYVREITGLTTKQVVQGLNKLRERYLLWKREDILSGEHA
jgi:hypothetical protein